MYVCVVCVCACVCVCVCVCLYVCAHVAARECVSVGVHVRACKYRKNVHAWSSVLQCVAVCCSVLQNVAVCCSVV